MEVGNKVHRFVSQVTQENRDLKSLLNNFEVDYVKKFEKIKEKREREAQKEQLVLDYMERERVRKQ